MRDATTGGWVPYVEAEGNEPFLEASSGPPMSKERAYARVCRYRKAPGQCAMAKHYTKLDAEEVDAQAWKWIKPIDMTGHE